MASTSLLTCLLIVFLSIKATFSYYILVDAHDQECFFEKLTSGTKLLLTYEVIEGGFLDVDVKVKKNEMFLSLFDLQYMNLYLFYR